jgi:hypothetical protein
MWERMKERIENNSELLADEVWKCWTSHLGSKTAVTNAVGLDAYSMHAPVESGCKHQTLHY